MDLGKLAFVSKRPMVFGMAISWLIFNIVGCDIPRLKEELN